MNKMIRTVGRYLAAIALVGCAGMSRSCSSCNAENFGSDWVVVQLDMNGHAFRCWELRNVSITNEHASDGIYWQDNESSNLVHISGLYNRVQVTNGRWDSAFQSLGLTRQACEAVRLRVDSPSSSPAAVPSP